jgi:hypothetical protein
MDHLLDEKASMIIYFCFIKYHQGNIIEVMSKKASFLKKLLKKTYIKEDGCFGLWIISSHY